MFSEVGITIFGSILTGDVTCFAKFFSSIACPLVVAFGDLIVALSLRDYSGFLGENAGF